MFSSQLVSFAVITTLVSSAAATFQILSPGAEDWWVAQSENVIAWSCNTDVPASTNNAFQLLVNNTNPAILTAAEAIVANVPNADCSFTVTTQQANLTPSTGYTVILADPINVNKVYAVSEPFEVKALGASYPTTTPSASSSASQTGASGTSSGTGSTSSATSTPKSNGAFASFKVPAAGVLAAVGAAIGML